VDGDPIAERPERADLRGVRPSVERQHAGWDSRGIPDQTEIEGRVKELKRDIALHRYDVDADAVADAILSKLQLVKRGRRALAVSAVDRSLRVVDPPRRH
jgi:hypothetical protein